MPSPVISAYLQEILKPAISHLGVPVTTQVEIALDIEERLEFLLGAWPDQRRRRTLLEHGVEEATFYEPTDAPVLVRALVVVAIRNSLLEDLASTAPTTLGLPDGRQALDDTGLRALTRASIDFWRAQDLNRLGRLLGPVRPDRIPRWRTQFPRTWRAFTMLADQQTQRVALPTFTGAAVPLAWEPSGEPSLDDASVVMSGINPRFDPQLLARLRLIAQGHLPVFFTDSFKSVSRHRLKLYWTIEFVLSHDAAFVTQNYLFTPTAVMRRSPLMRPAHTDAERMAKFDESMGLQPEHRDLLTQIAEILRS